MTKPTAIQNAASLTQQYREAKAKSVSAERIARAEKDKARQAKRRYKIARKEFKSARKEARKSAKAARQFNKILKACAEALALEKRRRVAAARRVAARKLAASKKAIRATPRPKPHLPEHKEVAALSIQAPIPEAMPPVPPSNPSQDVSAQRMS